MTIVQRLFMGIGMLFVGLLVLGGILGMGQESDQTQNTLHTERVHELDRALKSPIYRDYVSHDLAWDTTATLILVDYGDDKVSSEAWVAASERRLATLRRESRALLDIAAAFTDAQMRAVLSRAAETRQSTTRAIAALRKTVVHDGDQDRAVARITRNIDSTDAAFDDFVDMIRPYAPAKQVAEFVSRRNAQGDELLKRIAPTP